MLNMTKPYSYDLHWRIVWAYHRPINNLSQQEISTEFHMSERTVHRYLQLFNQTGDVQVRQRRNGPQKILGSFEQLILMRLILAHPGIYLHELQEKLYDDYGVIVSVQSIC